jgi:6-phosphofructokinase 1
VIETARLYPQQIGKVLAGKNGIVGALKGELFDTSLESDADIRALCHTPAGAFGSCRYKLKSDKKEEFEKLLSVFKAHHVGYFFYNGGGDSQDTTHKMAEYSQAQGYPLICLGIPKTIDNDLPFTDNCPGFGSVAKYVAVSILEASLDVASMAATSTKVFILEVMGRHAGWIAAAGALAQRAEGDAPHLILLPEVPFDEARFLAQVQETVKTKGFCSIVVSEGVRDAQGHFLSESNTKDAFGHAQLGGVAQAIAAKIQTLGLKYHLAIADYLQRSARHIASQVDVEHAYALGKAAVELAIQGHNAVMPVIRRLQDEPYQWDIQSIPLSQVANVERKMPPEFIRPDGFGITEACRRYLQPLIQGEAYPPYEKGIPQYVRLKNKLFGYTPPP